MSKQTNKPIALAISAALAATAVGVASADTSPFSMSNLVSGYMLDAGGDAPKKGEEGKCGEGKCGEKKGEEGKCGEGKCGEKKGKEGKCGEGKCGGKKDKGAEGSCGENKDKSAEGNCGGMR
ncbi:MAG TPA: hypothetical protein VF254_10235 [Gammaproteobacteria bacterium]